MRYYYEIFEQESPAVKPKKVGDGTEHTLHTVLLASDQFIRIEDNLKQDGAPIFIHTNDEFHAWYEDMARAMQWRNRTLDTDRGNKIEETISTMVSQPVGVANAVHKTNSLTLGQLKLEDRNVKTAAAAKKPRVAAVPPIAIMALGAAMQNGADKYGLFNWRETSVTATVFYNAMLRHLEQWYSGENHASDSGIHHLAHLMAGAAIILDAEMNGVFNDDRAKGVPLGDDYAKYFLKDPK